MIKRILFFILISLVLSNSFAQVSVNEGLYGAFTSRSFVKYNRFLSVPTFSALHEKNMNVSALVRNSNSGFEDAPALYMFTSSGRLNNRMGVGLTVYQQTAGIFKNFGVVTNFANQLEVGGDKYLTFGMNLSYSRRVALMYRVLTDTQDPTLQNYQPVPIVILQPGLTYTHGLFDFGVMLENIVDYNMKKGNMITGFSEKIISLHLGHKFQFESAKGLFKDASFRSLAIAKKEIKGFGFDANFIADLPKLGWMKFAYSNLFGINAGLGVNVNSAISIGFNYGTVKNLGTTNEIGIMYNLANTKRRYSPIKNRVSPRVEAPTNIVSNNSSNKDRKALKKAQKSINDLNDKVNNVLELLKENKEALAVVKTQEREPAKEAPESVEEEPVKEEYVMDMSLPRSTKTPWRDEFISVKNKNQNSGDSNTGGTMYYVCVYQYRDINKVKSQLRKYRKRGVDVNFVRSPKTDLYYLYIDKFKKAKNAEAKRKEVNGGFNGFEKKGGLKKRADLMGIQIEKMRKISKDPVFVEKITFPPSGASRITKQRKRQMPPRVFSISVEGVEPGYYIRVSIESSKPYADKLIDELRKDNIQADSFYQKANNSRHVYIYKTDDRDDAIRMYNNNVNSSYFNKKTIVNVM